jgi:hypothetical protein
MFEKLKEFGGKRTCSNIFNNEYGKNGKVLGPRALLSMTSPFSSAFLDIPHIPGHYLSLNLKVSPYLWG